MMKPITTLSRTVRVRTWSGQLRAANRRVAPELLFDNADDRGRPDALAPVTPGNNPQISAATAGGTAAKATGHSCRIPVQIEPMCQPPCTPATVAA